MTQRMGKAPRTQMFPYKSASEGEKGACGRFTNLPMDFIVELSHQGYGNKRIARILCEQRGLVVSHMTIQRRLAANSRARLGGNGRKGEQRGNRIARGTPSPQSSHPKARKGGKCIHQWKVDKDNYGVCQLCSAEEQFPQNPELHYNRLLSPAHRGEYSPYARDDQMRHAREICPPMKRTLTL